MAGIRAEIVGGKELIEKLDKMKQSVPAARNAGVYAVNCAILADSLRRVPVDTGTLKGSGYVTLPSGQGGDSTVGYGGPAEAYALVQHEREDYHHEVGEAKYLEKAVKAIEPKAGEIFLSAMLKALERLENANPTAKYPTDPNAAASKRKGAGRSKRGPLTPGKNKGRP